MPVLSELSVCSYNCRSIKSSLPDVWTHCESHDIILLQEHWLLPFEMDTLSNFHYDFIAIGISAVDISQNILVGRSYGDTIFKHKAQLILSISRRNLLRLYS